MADHVHDLRLLHRIEHLLALLDVHRQRLFAQHMFAGARGGDRDFSMRIVGRVNVHDVDVLRIDHFLPVRGGAFPPELFAGLFDRLRVPAADGAHLNFGAEGEEMRSLPPRVRMGLAHETVADHSDTQRFRHMKSAFLK